MSDNIYDLLGSYKEGVLEACDAVYEYKKNRICNVNTWW